MLDFQFSKFQIFNGWKGQEGKRASWCQISWRIEKPFTRYGDFSFYKMAAAAILDFKNLKILTVERVNGLKLRYQAKFNGFWDIAIFRLFKTWAAAIFEFFNG